MWCSIRSNSDDCGVFVAKVAEHIAMGQPLNFTNEDIESFRYSLILDVVDTGVDLD